MATPHGIEITKADAQKLVNRQLAITTTNGQFVADDCTSRGEHTAAIYYNALIGGEPANCYVFDIDFVTNLAEAGATQLMVILGAHDTETEEHQIGKPTAILLGCTMKVDLDGTELFTSLPDKKAIEHPPVMAISTLP